VKEIKIEAKKKPDDCVKRGDPFFLILHFNSIDSGDKLRVTPTSESRGIILAESNIAPFNEYAFYNGFDGLPGSTTGVFSGTNSTSIAIAWLHFTPVAPSVRVITATSSLPSHFNPRTGILDFASPISPHQPVDFEFTINHLLPFSVDDSDPFTRVRVQSLHLLFLPMISSSGSLATTPPYMEMRDDKLEYLHGGHNRPGQSTASLSRSGLKRQ
jgi:hypothetical protein